MKNWHSWYDPKSGSTTKMIKKWSSVFLPGRVTSGGKYEILSQLCLLF